ncbi:MAG TPA: D-aminoacylase [Verrucomicrobiae bacterium]|nr:D-aminoacylase [Verrucomicrobiae bacterium]
MKLFGMTLAAILLTSASAKAQEPAYDFLIQGATVFDGVSSKARQADVAVKGERIAAVGKLAASDARQVIDGRGLFLMPGFIDAHTHSDMNEWVYPGLANKVFQGVTTEIVGNCGMSAAPAEGQQPALMPSIWAREGVKLPGPVEWKEFSDYRAWYEKLGGMTNIASLAGHGNIRASVMGMQARPATPEELEAMKDLLRRAMNDGAIGISYGLIYLPGIYADEKELTELCKVAAEFDGICAFHMRNEGSRLIEAIEETLRIGEAAGAKIQISHLKAAGKNNWPKIDEALRLIDEARKQGLRVRADAYPYQGSAAELGVVLPDEIFTREDRLQLFMDDTKRPELIKQLKDYYREHPRDWNAVMIASVANEADQQFSGKTLQEVAAKQGLSPEETLVGLLERSAFEISAFSFSQSLDVIDKVLAQPYVAVGSDSIADGSDYPHPRAFGTFSRLLAHEMQGTEASAAAFIRKNTSESADYFGLKDRGRIQAGGYADLVLADPGKLRDNATYDHPKEFSSGMQWVFVNGVPVIERGELHAGARPGRLLASAPEKVS